MVNRKGMFAYLGGREEHYHRDVNDEKVTAHNETGIDIVCLVSSRFDADSVNVLESNGIRAVSRVGDE